MEHLNEVVAARRATLSTYAETSETEIIIGERILNFVQSGNPEKVLKWCENLETHCLTVNGKRSQIKM